MSKFISNTSFTAWHTCDSKDRDGPASFLPSFLNLVTLSTYLPSLQNCMSNVIHPPTQPKTECIAFGRGTFMVHFEDTTQQISLPAVTEMTQCSSLLPSSSCSFPHTSIMQEPGEQGKEHQ